ncbi:TPA: helix-turn-helix transcriptional regulator [Vibrio harveyi]|uniref:helix-turn-helix domain-containing protein n=1 Tax=Vibrio harveyi group TaxID=717610 RepID=UPI00028E4ACA|nr:MULTISPECIES: helix-turn-helix transcriptional regulator [Vibrio harveyi group]EKM18593.1 helix-turn-helix family protein [Vibrio harveyi]MCG9609277.1 helix-turn-helix domain-containing protein [Vibrio harveyi]MCG9668777.1 helix-turn-helix domain-containing protein [Vibrio harveyi]MCV3263003.1 helix-turn-helix domain-containing protein [Vibrio harveyi]MCV3263007.1 helix-turn-helix domain-containing protein [Vibrio harveyi]
MLNENIKRLREEKGVTQIEIAQAVGTSAKTVMNWESGKTEPKASELLMIAKRLGVSVNEVLGQEESKHEKLLEKISSAIDGFNDSEIESLSIMIEGLYLRNQSNKARENFSGKTR